MRTALSTDQLAAAFSDVRLPSWPTSLDAALAHPLQGRLVRMHAMLRLKGITHATVHLPAVQAPCPAQPGTTTTRRPAYQRGPAFDPKRAACGERDD